MTQKNNTIAVIGAGVMGSGIAQKYATSGFPVTIIDKDQAALAKSQLGISATLTQGVERGIFKADEAQAIYEGIKFSNDLAAVKTADLVVEAIFENRAAKISLFRQLEEVCSTKAMLATNTSSLKVVDLQAELKHKARFLGLHYFYHPAKNRLVELIGTHQTDSSVLAQAKAIQESINKVVIESKDSPGFIVNRFFVPWLNEAMRIVDESVANIATVESAAKQVFKIGMGPFTLMNVTGLPITLHASTALADYMGPFYAPCPLIISQLESGKPWDLAGVVDEEYIIPIAMRLMAVVTSISSQMVFDEQVCTVESADMGARVGLLWEKGPFELFALHKDGIQLALKTMATLRANSHL
jgi:enoyl-CoA hydratase / 3-hydroxyacyl-CoA dehydrogenase